MNLPSSLDSNSPSTVFMRHYSADGSENELEVDDRVSLETDHEPDEILNGHHPSMINEEDEDVKMAISALSVMKTGGPSRSSFDFIPPPFDPQRPPPPHHHLLHPHPQPRLEPDLLHPSPTIHHLHHPQNHTPSSNPHSPLILQTSPQPSSPAFTSHSLPTSVDREQPLRTSSSSPSPPEVPRATRPLTHPPLSGFYLDLDGKPVDANGQPVDVVQVEDPEGGVFLQRVGRMPLVSGVVRAYERGKGTSRVVKYGADLVESSVTSISGRVVSSVGPERIAQIDRYAGAALDRLGQFSGIQPPAYHREIQSSSSESHYSPHPSDLSSAHYPEDRAGLRRRNLTITASNQNALVYEDLEMGPAGSHILSNSSQDPHRQSSSRSNHESPQASHESDLETPAASPGGRLVQVANHGRSRWQSMLVEAGMTAGGIGAAVSEESMKSLKYCLQWLQYATAHLDHQITVLRDFIISLNVSGTSSNALISPSAVRTLANIKKEIVETIRKVVDVVSKYAGGALPEQAKQFVRKSILSLPIKWASTIQAEHSLNPRKILAQAGLSTSHQQSQVDRNVASTSQALHTTRGTTEIAADRVLSFAVEGLDMLKSVTGIFSESVDRADAWVERLRVIGIQHRQQRASNGTVEDLPHEDDPLDEPRPISRPTRGMSKRSEGSHPSKGSSDSLATVKTDGMVSSGCSRDNTFRRSGVRSRDSSASTCGATSNSSLVSGGELSTSSINTTNTTLTTTTTTTDSNPERHFPDRVSVKRRKANGGYPRAYTNAPEMIPAGHLSRGLAIQKDERSSQRIGSSSGSITDLKIRSVEGQVTEAEETGKGVEDEEGEEGEEEEEEEVRERPTSTLKRLLHHHNVDEHDDWNDWGDNP